MRTTWIVAALGLVGVAAVGVSTARGRAGSPSPGVRLATTRVDRGDVIEGVHATGTVQPRVLVSVGTQVSGVIDQIFKDWNDPVRAGEVIAVLDSRRLVSQVLQDEASLGRAQADLERTEALLEQAEKDLGRTRTLSARRLVSEADLDAARANWKSLRAQCALNAAVVSSSFAQLDGDRVNLKLATIVSPVDGVVVSRTVDVGQTMAAQFQAPTLFQIANDLKKVQIQVSVPEADVGRVRVHQRATFRVDAYPDQVFEGRLSQVRLAATTVSNVVTYTVLVDAENPDERLLPGMTANVTFEVRREPAALRVPVSALRFEPPADLVEATGPIDPEEARVYVRGADGRCRPVRVLSTVTDGVRVAVAPVVSGSLEVGSEVATAVQPDDEEEAPASAFRVPPPPGAKKTGKRGP